MSLWIQHVIGTDAEGKIICTRCGLPMNQMMPLNTVLAIRDGWISFGLRPDATLCQVKE